jgi:hypothetical protein
LGGLRMLLQGLEQIPGGFNGFGHVRKGEEG